MKIRSRYWLVLLLCILSGTACKKDFLEFTPQDGSLSDVTIFNKQEDFNAVIVGAYAEMQSFSASGTFWIVLPGFISHDMNDVSENPKQLGEYLTGGNGDIKGYWTTLYTIVGRANLLIERLSTTEVLTDEEKTRNEGEAKFLRGFAYLKLAEAFGNIPMPLTTYNDSLVDMACADEAAVWEQVILDLKDAAQKLPEAKEWDEANVGRASKGAALGYLVYAYMFKKDWDNAADASQSLMTLTNPRYTLLTDLRSVFSPSNENHDESLFEVQFKKVDDGNAHWGWPPDNGSVFNAWTAPRSIDPAYAVTGGWGESVVSLKAANSFEAGDKRRELFIKLPGETYKGEYMASSYTIPFDILQSRSAFCTKFWLGPADRYFNEQNVSQLRYAEFLLNYAEILFERGASGDAYTYLNQVRTRAGLPSKAATADREVFFRDLMNERRHELIFEPEVWWHYTRTGRAAKFLLEEYGVTMEQKWNHLPVPQSERDQNPNLCSNGY